MFWKQNLVYKKKDINIHTTNLSGKNLIPQKQIYENLWQWKNFSYDTLVQWNPKGQNVSHFAIDCHKIVLEIYIL